MKKKLKLLAVTFFITTFISLTLAQHPNVKCADDFVKTNVATGKIKARDLYGIWIYQSYGNFDFFKRVEKFNDGLNNPQWQNQIKVLSDDFEALPDIYEKDGIYDIEPGDLMVYFIPGNSSTAVGVVNSINANKLVADISIYFEDSKKTERNTNFPLSLMPENASVRVPRAGLSFVGIVGCYE